MPKKAKRKVSRPTLPMQRHLNLRDEGRCFDLREIFERVNARHFRGRLRVIRIHPLLDQPFVPRWFLEYVLYHEMLHSVVPDETNSAGRRRIHTAEFYRRERAFPRYRRARQWEDENLARFVR